ncbi:hypothetical protein [Jejuia pallidilutea]|nr:hypothetical protein [Jejuia pallidilutea]
MIRFVLFIMLVLAGSFISAQEIKINDDVYEEKKGLIIKNGVDVTNILSDAEKSKILAAFEKKKLEIAKTNKAKEKLEKAEKQQKRAEKQQKKAEQKQKKAEKILKQKEKAQANHDKAIIKHENAIEKYEKLKNKGKLSPEDERKWLEKIEKLNTNISKTKKKLK